MLGLVIKKIINKIMRSFKKTIKQQSLFLILKLKQYRLEDSLIICGDPRSGTTWLLELLSHLPKVYPNWEPLHSDYGIVPKSYHWSNKGSSAFRIPKGKEDDFSQLFGEVLRFKVSSEWTIKMAMKQPLVSAIRSERVLTKFVRANLLLPFIVSHYHLKHKPVLLLRHPIDVCLSQIKAFPHLSKTPSGQLPEWITEEPYGQDSDFLQTLDSLLGYAVFRWCHNNCPLLEDKATLKQVHIIFYSDLVEDPKVVIRHLLLDWGVDQWGDGDIEPTIDLMNFNKASVTDFANDYIPDKAKQLEKNRQKLSQQEKDKIQTIFDYFNFQLYDAYSVYPKKHVLEKVCPSNATNILLQEVS